MRRGVARGWSLDLLGLVVILAVASLRGSEASERDRRSVTCQLRVVGLTGADAADDGPAVGEDPDTVWCRRRRRQYRRGCGGQ